MTRGGFVQRQGRTCRWCGYPLHDDQESLCTTCLDWRAGTVGSQSAQVYAEREQRKEEQKRWEKRR